MKFILATCDQEPNAVPVAFKGLRSSRLLNGAMDRVIIKKFPRAGERS